MESGSNPDISGSSERNASDGDQLSSLNGDFGVRGQALAACLAATVICMCGSLY